MNKTPFQPLETPRLKLRCIATTDAETMSTLMTPEVSKWIAYWPVPFTLDMANQRIKNSLERAFKNDGLPFAVTTKDNDQMIGWVSISRNKEDHQRASFGYWLGEEHQNKGYMKELAPIVN